MRGRGGCDAHRGCRECCRIGCRLIEGGWGAQVVRLAFIVLPAPLAEALGVWGTERIVGHSYIGQKRRCGKRQADSPILSRSFSEF